MKSWRPCSLINSKLSNSQYKLYNTGQYATQRGRMILTRLSEQVIIAYRYSTAIYYNVYCIPVRYIFLFFLHLVYFTIYRWYISHLVHTALNHTNYCGILTSMADVSGLARIRSTDSVNDIKCEKSVII